MTKEQIRAIWMDGFSASGEGYNGEYPFGDWANSPVRSEALMACQTTLEEDFERWYLDWKKINDTGARNSE